MSRFRVYARKMDAKTYSARLYGPQVEEVERLIDEEGLSKSEAIRKLVADGAREYEQRRRQQPGDIAAQLGWAALAGAVAGVALGFSLVGGVAAVVAALLFVGGAVDRWRRRP